MRKSAPIILLLSLVACASAPSIHKAGPPPDHYRQIIANDLRATPHDAYAMQDVALSQPEPWRDGSQTGWRVCFQANAKNALNGYNGFEETLYFFEQGALVAVEEHSSDCNDAIFARWSLP